MFSMDSLNMSAEMETEPPKNEVYNVTTALKNEFTSKIKEVEHVFKKLADVTKSHDQTKQELRKTLCKTCRDKSYVIFKSPQKTYSDFGGQTDQQSLQPESINGGKPDLRVDIISKEHQPGEDDTPHQQELTPAKHITKLESIIQELQDSNQRRHRQVEKLQATLETVEKERDDYKRQVDNQQIEIVRIRQQTNCDSDSQHAARTQSSGVTSQEEKFDELVQDFGKGGDTAQNLVQGNQEHDQKIINSLRNENEGKSNAIEEYSKKIPGSTEDEEVNRLKKENSTLQEDRNKCSYNLRSRKEQDDKQTQHLEQMRQDKGLLEQNVDQLNERVANLKADLDKKMTENETLAKEKSVLTKENEEIRKQMNGVKLNLQQMEGTLSQTKSKLEKTEEKNRKLTGTLTDRDAELESLTTAKDKLLSQIELAKNEKAQIQHEFDEQKDKIKKENSSITDTQNENRKLANTLAERNREIESAEQEKKQIRSQIERTIQERDQIQVKLDEEKQKFDSAKTKITGMQSENRNLTDILASRDEELRSVKSERDQLTSQMQDAEHKNLNVQRELQDKHHKLKEEMKTLQQKHDQIKETLDQRTLSNRKLEEENAHLKANCGISEERLQTLHDNHHKLKGEMTTLQQEHDQTKKTLAETTLSNRNMGEVQAHLKAECASRDEELRSTKCKREKLNSQLKDAQQDKLNIQHKLDEQTRKLEQTERQLLKAKKDIQNLTESLRISEERLQTLHGNHHKLKGEMTTLQQEHDQTKKTLAETTLSNRKMGELQAHLQAECDKQREEIQQCNQQIEELKKPRKKRIVLGLRSERSGLGKSLVDMVTREMTSRLQKRLDMYNLNLVVSFSQVSSEVTNGFQIALCLNMSRVGTNIVDSIKGMKVDRDLFVMVLHHTNRENLSSLTPTSHRVTGSEVRQLGGILDMAFSSDSGLYDCDLNNAAMDKIAVILKKCLIL